MSPFKHRFLAAMLVILIPMANIANAATSSTSRSMKSGFSSQKSQPQRTNANTNPSNKSSRTSFGSFGQQRGNTSGRSDSALNRDLEKNQAQQQALKNMDARSQAKFSSRPEQQSSVTGKPLNPVQSALPSTSQTPVAPTVIVQRDSGSMGAAFMGFMLGQAISRPHTVPPAPSYDTRRSDLEPIAGGDDTSYRNSGVGESVNGALATGKVQPEATKSGAWSVLRFLLWLGFLTGLIWMAYKIFRIFSPRRQAMSHYSLGKV
jgi:hypothetical protein